MGRRVGRADHSLRRGDRRDVGAAARLAATGPTSGDDARSRDEYRTDRESVGEAIGEHRSKREAKRDRGAVDLRAAIPDRASVGDTSTIDDTRADSRTRGRGAAALRQRIEDGEPLDSDIDVAVRRCADPIARSIAEQSTAAIDLTGSIAVGAT